MKKVLATLLLSAIYLFAEYSSIALYVNNEDIEVKGDLLLYTKSDQIKLESGYYVTANMLNMDEGFTEGDDATIFGAGVYIKNSVIGTQGLEMAFGLNGEFGDIGKDKLFALPIMMSLSYKLPIDYYTYTTPTTFNAKLLYAPSPLAFSDSDKYLEYRFFVEIEMIEHIDVTFGYRYIDVDMNNEDTKSRSAVYGGLKFFF
ncbi:MAG: hypothetical protein GXO31_04450 [Epsilonproteobacteria bacterium]|nr:hypothetical protein [Campylobacterota bacterium]